MAWITRPQAYQKENHHLRFGNIYEKKRYHLKKHCTENTGQIIGELNPIQTDLSIIGVLQVYMWMAIPLRDFESPAPQTVCRPWKYQIDDNGHHWELFKYEGHIWAVSTRMNFVYRYEIHFFLRRFGDVKRLPTQLVGVRLHFIPVLCEISTAHRSERLVAHRG